ncbi:DUF3710 domain-containing protein [Streptomyces canus]|uniref:DUF3710 domain-containing protein n=1 Tax=Streptomyces canus TaxID=58343 RepID=UPI0009975D84
MCEDESSGAVGPWDESDARRPRGGELVDLGGLLVPTRAGAEMRLMTSRDGSLVAVAVIRGRTAIQLQAFRTLGDTSWRPSVRIWPVRCAVGRSGRSRGGVRPRACSATTVRGGSCGAS